YVIWLDGIVGDGTVNSTVNDLLKWDRALYNEKFISKEETKDVFDPTASTTRDMKTNYGMGWFLQTDKNCGKLAWHTGGWPGYRTYIERQLEQDRTIIILQNHNKVVFPIADIHKFLCGSGVKK
ncbi:MAG: serine hydrolase, partial [Sediminibacterium sp.]